MPHPDSSRMPSSERWNEPAPWPVDPAAPREHNQRHRRHRARRPDHVEDARTGADPDGNEEQERQRRDAAAPPSSRPMSSQMDSEAWVAALPFTSEELEDTWPNLSGRSIFDDDR